MSSVNQDMSLFIPRVFLNITGDRIKMAMQELGLGQAERVDLVNKGNYNAAYVHFKVWNNNSFVAQFQERAADPEQKCTLEYDCPWYWIVLENTSAKRIGPERRKEVINLREEPFPSELALAPGLESNVPYSVLEDLMWDMEQMQGTINELRAILEASGYQFQDDELEPELEESATSIDEINRELRFMRQEIEQLSEAISGRERVITCAVTGNKFREVHTIEYKPITESVDQKPKLNGLTRDFANCVATECELRRSETYLDTEFWEDWKPIEVPSEDVPGMCNQMFKNKVTGEIADLGDLMELGLSTRYSREQMEVEVTF